MYLGRERRKHKRLQKPFMVKFSISQNTPKTEWHNIAVLDIGAGGSLFYYNRKLDIDSSLQVKIECTLAHKTIFCTGHVVRLDEIVPGNLYLSAIVFSGMSQEDSILLDEIVEEYNK